MNSINNHKYVGKFVAVTLGLNLLASTGVLALEVEGYAEPYRSISVAADESGTVEEVLVIEGQSVEAGQSLMRLNSAVFEALLAIAEQNMQAQGRLDAAKADALMRSNRLEKLQSLRTEGHARQEEVDRAVSEVAVSEANVRTAQEDSMSKRLEYEKIKAQIARRTVRAPMAGVVAMLHKDQGEYIAPNSPEVLTLVQIDTLLANFTLTSYQIEKLHVGQDLEVKFIDSTHSANGIIEFISPITDAESGTVLIRVRVDNSNGRFRSGERCKIQIGG